MSCNCSKVPEGGCCESLLQN
uniref:Uncharacterized protein n=1 Tax=Rhizophora mucronata TaxID=61149 RepID=A0A2P2LHZ1_RHIMU